MEKKDLHQKNDQSCSDISINITYISTYVFKVSKESS
jgi:hypothetical protein